VVAAAKQPDDLPDGAVQPERAGAGVVALDHWARIVYVANRTLPR